MAFARDAWSSAGTTVIGALLAVILLAGASTVEGEPVKVRLVEGNVRGFLVLRTLNGEVIAHGELTQRPSGRHIESRLALTFADGSVWDERVPFSQGEVFRLEGYRLVQRGPSWRSTSRRSWVRVWISCGVVP